ncbi:MAG: 50S ribosomal protein L21e [Candidatus Thorarchaeota archaeon]
MTLHKGYRNKTRKRHKKNVRERGLGSIDKYLIDYEIGNKVDIITDPSKHRRGMPHRRFHGLTGTIIGVRGRCYEIRVKLGNSKKTLIVGKEHLRVNNSSLKPE